MNPLKNYKIFGFSVNSDLILPEIQLAEGSRDVKASLLIRRGDANFWPARHWSECSTSNLKVTLGECRIAIEGLFRLRVVDGCLLQWQPWNDKVSARDVRTFAVSSGLGTAAIQRGLLVMHGTALEFEGQAILLVGHPASGKSTLAWCLIQRGWRLVSSEICALSENGVIWPGLQQLKLWHDAVEQLGINKTQIKPVRQGLKRYTLLPPDVVCSEQPIQLKCLYVLGKRMSYKTMTERSNQETKTKQFQASKAFSYEHALLTMRNRVYHPRIYQGMEMEDCCFRQIATLVWRLPVHHIQVPEGIENMAACLENVNLVEPLSFVGGSEVNSHDNG